MIRVYETVLYKVVSVLEIKANCISSKVKNQILPILFAMITICALFYSCTSVSVHLLIKCVIGSIIFAVGMCVVNFISYAFYRLVKSRRL